MFFFVLSTNVVLASSIGYEIYNLSTPEKPELIGEGKKIYAFKDIEVAHPLMTWKKQINLEQGFHVGCVIQSSRTKVEGFALYAKKKWNDFSWEWFDWQSPGKYKKRQGDGLLSVYFVPTDNGGKKIAKIVFDTDIFLKSKVKKECDFVILVKTGSSLNFTEDKLL